MRLSNYATRYSDDDVACLCTPSGVMYTVYPPVSMLDIPSHDRCPQRSSHMLPYCGDPALSTKLSYIRYTPMDRVSLDQKKQSGEPNVIVRCI